MLCIGIYLGIRAIRSIRVIRHSRGYKNVRDSVPYFSSGTASLCTERKEDEILNIDQAAEFLKISKSTLYTLTSQKRIPHFKKGKKLYFKLSELLLWIESGKKMTQEEFDKMSEERLSRR